MKTIYFIAGLPRSGSSLISAILKQNPNIHSQSFSSLSEVLYSINSNWSNIESNIYQDNNQSKIGVLKSTIEGYYQHIDKPVVFDRNFNWLPLIDTVESVLQKQIKILVCVRNPAEILSSYERLYRENPLHFNDVNFKLKNNTSIESRAYHYAGPKGILGKTHSNIKDAVIMGHLDKMLFVDYNLFCGNPKSETKRIYDFFNLSNFEHDFNNIIDNTIQLPKFLKVKPELSKTTINCVQYLGLNLYEQYNREIFWNAWI
jgi:sulfotransferase